MTFKIFVRKIRGRGCNTPRVSISSIGKFRFNRLFSTQYDLEHNRYVQILVDARRRRIGFKFLERPSVMGAFKIGKHITRDKISVFSFSAKLLFEKHGWALPEKSKQFDVHVEGATNIKASNYKTLRYPSIAYIEYKLIQ